MASGIGARPRRKGIPTLRKSAFAVLLAVPVASACTSLLGDFTSSGIVGGGPDATTDDGGTLAVDGSMSQRDGATLSDGGATNRDGATGSEAGPDAAPAPALLACAEGNAMNRLNLTLNPNGAGPEPAQYGALAIANLPGTAGEVRVVAAADDGLHAFTFSQSSSSVTDTVFAFNPGNTNVFDIERYQGGFAVLVLDMNAENEPVLAVERIEDSASAWSPEYVVSGTNPIDPVTDTSISASVAVVNPSTNEFYIAIYDTEIGEDGGYNDVLRWQHVQGTGAPGNLPHLASFPADTYSLPSPSFAFTMTNSYLLVQPGGNGGPSVATSAIFTISPMGIGPGLPVPFQDTLSPPSGDTLFAVGMTNSVLTPGSANLAFLEGNLNTAQLSYYVGQAPATNLDSLAWQNLTQSSPGIADAGYTLEDLPVNHGSFHWESFPSPANPTSENLLAVSTISGNQSVLGDQGLNFVWWDAVTGYMRASRTGGRRLLPDVNGLGYANATFASPPSTLITNVLVAYEVQTSEAETGPTTSNVWLTQINCSLAP